MIQREEPDRGSSGGRGAERHGHWIASARRQFNDARKGGRAAGFWPASGLPPHDSIPGYIIQSEIHRGGQGIVYRGLQASTGRAVAIKVLREGAFADRTERLRFEREVRVLGALQHPGVVTIHDYGAVEGSFYFTMDYIAGRPLDEYVRDAGRPVEAVVEVFAKICDAVNAVHLLGIVHRDIKPRNILISENGRPFVLDFGLAKSIHDPDAAESQAPDRTIAGQFVGSLPWASPEQIRSNVAGVDTRSDVYSLGVVLYHALTGKFPYDLSGPPQQAIAAIQNAEPVPPRRHRRELPADIETILLKCLDKKPDRRYRTAGDLADDLRAFLESMPISARRDSLAYVMRKGVARHRAAFAVAALIAVVLTVSTIVSVTYSIRATRAAFEAQDAKTTLAVAERQATSNLHESLIAQARALRRGGIAGQRVDALAALRKAAEINPTREVRNEAISAMAVADLVPTRTLIHDGAGHFDPDLTQCANEHPDGSVTIIRVEDDRELIRIPPPAGGIRESHAIALRGPFFIRLFDPPEGHRHLEVWHVPEARLLLELEDVPFRARFGISPDGKRLAIGRLDRAIHIYDLETHQPIQRIQLDREPSYVEFDPTGRRLALFHGNFLAAQVLDLDTGAMEPIFESQVISWSVNWDPHGRWIAGSAGTNIELWDLHAKRRIALLAGHEEPAAHMAVSPDGTKLLSYGWSSGTIMWDVVSAKPLMRIPLARPVFSPDGQFVAGSSMTEDGKSALRYFRFLCDDPRRRLMSFESAVGLCRPSGGFDPNSGLLIFASADGAVPGVLRVFDPYSGRELARQSVPDLGAMALDRAGRFMVASHADGLYRWPIQWQSNELTIGPPVRISQAQPAEVVVLSADSRLAVSGMFGLAQFEITDLTTGELRQIHFDRRGNSVHISPDGRWVSIGQWYGDICEVWEAATGRLAATLPQVESTSVEFTNDSSALMTSERDGMSVWETGTWRLLRKGPPVGLLRGMSPDGSMIAAMPDHARLRLVDFTTLDEIATLEPPEPCYTYCTAFSPDSSMLAQFTGRDGDVHLWDLRRVRTELAGMGLDWNRPPYDPAPAHSPSTVKILTAPMQATKTDVSH